MRLSRDDENYGDRVSIETQRTILRQFAEDNDLHIVDEYIDDGYSGTNFNRPAFQRMIEDIESGKVNTVCTKDLSRFGREHVMMDYFLEFYFPEKKVRYIAVSDNEDTERGLSDLVPVKNIFNEWFAKDTSKKVKNALHAKHLAGERTFTYAPLGYKRDPEKKNSIIIDEETRWIIEKIFSMAAHGAGSAKITKTLIEEKVPTPGYLLYQKYGKFANIYEGAPEEKSYSWTIAVVKSILKNETYIGNTIHNQQTNISYKNKKKVRKPKEEWIRVENTHEGIIDKDIFYQVQEQIESRKRKMKDADMQIFAGLLKCADCGWALSYGVNRSNKTPWAYYNCTQYRQFGTKLHRCSSHYIRYDVLYSYVLSRIRYWAKQAEIDEEGLLEKLLKTSDSERARGLRKQTAELRKAEKRKEEMDRLFTKLYEDWSAERINEYNFNMLTQKYQAEQVEIDEKIKAIRSELNTEKQTAEDTRKWIELIGKYTDPTELTAELLNTLIEKIVVHEATEDEFGFRTQEIEIYYRFVGRIDE
jgi:DNA invertase Pin-like site-specific DNA recombinase